MQYALYFNFPVNYVNCSDIQTVYIHILINLYNLYINQIGYICIKELFYAVSSFCMRTNVHELLSMMI